MNNHSLPVTIIVVSDQKRAMIWRSDDLRGRGFERVRATVVKLSDEMTAPLRQRSQMLRGKVAKRENSDVAWFWPAASITCNRGNHKANKKRP